MSIGLFLKYNDISNHYDSVRFVLTNVDKNTSTEYFQRDIDNVFIDIKKYLTSKNFIYDDSKFTAFKTKMLARAKALGEKLPALIKEYTDQNTAVHISVPQVRYTVVANIECILDKPAKKFTSIRFDFVTERKTMYDLEIFIAPFKAVYERNSFVPESHILKAWYV